MKRASWMFLLIDFMMIVVVVVSEEEESIILQRKDRKEINKETLDKVQNVYVENSLVKHLDTANSSPNSTEDQISKTGNTALSREVENRFNLQHNQTINKSQKEDYEEDKASEREEVHENSESEVTTNSYVEETTKGYEMHSDAEPILQVIKDDEHHPNTEGRESEVSENESTQLHDQSQTFTERNRSLTDFICSSKYHINFIDLNQRTPRLGTNITSSNLLAPEVSTEALPNCDFSNGSCAWTLDGLKYKHYDWQMGNPETAYFVGGPSSDGSGEVSGISAGYAFVDGSVFSDLNLPDFYLTAWMSSPIIAKPQAQGSCLKFRYNTYGFSIQSLRVLRIDHVPTLYRNTSETYPESRGNSNNSSRKMARSLSEKHFPAASIGNEFLIKTINATEILWENSDSTNGLWRSGHVTYNSGYEHRLVFEVTPHLSTQMARGFAAVDDIIIQQSACDSDCSFESDFCLWTNNLEDNFDWKLARGSDNRFTGPIRDHGSVASYSRIGSYAVTNSSFPRRPGDQAWLDSVLLDNTSPLCLSFYASMFGAGVGGLSLQQIDDSGVGRTLWNVNGGSGSQLSWNLARVTLAAIRPFKARFVATVGDPGLGDIAIDSVRIESGSCSTIPSVARESEISCSFIDDMCGWEIKSSSSHLWRRLPGGHTHLALSHLQSPDHHVSFSVDGYQHREGATDILVSPIVDRTGMVCLDFWLRMASSMANKPNIGSLSVILISELNNNTRTIWRADNHVSENWQQARVSFNVQDSIRVGLKGIRGSGNSGAISVDDLIIYEGECDVQPAKAAVTEQDCSFDESLCNWKIENDSAKTWKLSTKRVRVAQLLDHTHNTEAGYIFFDPLNHRATTRLVSSDLTPQDSRNTQCFSMWYMTVGGVQEDATLSIRIRRVNSNTTSDVIWQVTQGVTGAPGRSSSWNYGQVTLPSMREPFQIIIEALGMQAGFAIDDIRSRSESILCSIRPVSAEPIITN